MTRVAWIFLALILLFSAPAWAQQMQWPLQCMAVEAGEAALAQNGYAKADVGEGVRPEGKIERWQKLSGEFAILVRAEGNQGILLCLAFTGKNWEPAKGPDKDKRA